MIVKPQTNAQTGREPRKLRQPLWVFGAVLLLTALVYWPSVSGKFIWNDADYVTAEHLRSADGLCRIWTELGATEQYYPLLHSWFWIQCQCFGDNPTGYHVVNILLHASAAWFFFMVLRHLAVPGAWLAAMLFALHPVHVESVAWITEQKNTLSAVFYFGAALAYLNFDDTRRKLPWILGFVLFFLSLLSKTVTATLAAALLVVFWWKRGRLEWRRDVLPLIPWLLLGGLWGIFTSWVEQRYLGAHGADFDLTLAQRVLVAGRAVWFYLEKIAWPVGLNFIYPRWNPTPGLAWQWLFPVALILLLVVAWRIRVHSRAPLALLLLFVGTLFPVLGFVNLYGGLYSFVWDHWQYLADYAPLTAIATSVSFFWNKLSTVYRGALGGAVAAVIVAFAVLSAKHCTLFRDDHTLFTRTIELNPDCWMAYNNLCSEQLILKNFPEALAYAKEAARSNPHNDAVQCNLGMALGFLGRKAEALACFQESVRLSPENVRENYNLAGSLMEFGHAAEALPYYEKAVRLSPTLGDAHNGLGLCLLRLGRVEEGLKSLTEAVRLDSKVARFHDDLGQTWMAVGHIDDACSCFFEAVRLSSGNPSFQGNLGVSLAMLGRTPEALEHLREAVRLAPQNASGYLNLALALRAAGRTDEAAAIVGRARELDPALSIPSGL